jgi:hypothetical protein
MQRVSILLALVVMAPGARAAGEKSAAPQPVQTTYAPDWQPEGLLDAQERRVGEASELYAAVGGVEVSVPKTLRCRVGFREELPVILARRGVGNQPLRITGICPPGVAVDPVDAEMGKRRTGRVTPAVQTLLPRPVYLALHVQVGRDSADIPLQLLPQPTYPMIGLELAAGDADALTEAGQCAAQIVEPVAPGVLAGEATGPGEAGAADDSWQQTVEAAYQRLRCQVQLNVASDAQVRQHLAAGAGAEALDAAVERLAAKWAGQVDAWVMGDAEARASDAMASMARTLAAADPDALVFTPALHASLGEAGGASFGAGSRSLALFSALLGTGLPPSVTGMALDVRPGAAAGAPASPAGGADDPARWAEADKAASLEPIVGLMVARSANIPLWCTIFAPAGDGDERLATLRTVRDAVIALSTGAASVIHAPRPGTSAASAAALEALGAAATELAGASRVRVEPERDSQTSREGGDISTALGSEITYRAFRRGDEAIVWIWSNSPKARHVTLHLRDEPQGLRTLAFSRTGDLVHRENDPLFVAQRESRTRDYLVGVRLAPLDIAAYTFPLNFITSDWLAGVTRGAPPEPKGAKP